MMVLLCELLPRPKVSLRSLILRCNNSAALRENIYAAARIDLLHSKGLIGFRQKRIRLIKHGLRIDEVKKSLIINKGIFLNKQSDEVERRRLL